MLTFQTIYPFIKSAAYSKIICEIGIIKKLYINIRNGQKGSVIRLSLFHFVSQAGEELQGGANANQSHGFLRRLN